jgi:hypothetical protein
MFHHLSRTVKEGTLREIVRVLAWGGELHLLDFTGSHGRAHARRGPEGSRGPQPAEDAVRAARVLPCAAVSGTDLWQDARHDLPGLRRRARPRHDGMQRVRELS